MFLASETNCGLCDWSPHQSQSAQFVELVTEEEL